MADDLSSPPPLDYEYDESYDDFFNDDDDLEDRLELLNEYRVQSNTGLPPIQEGVPAMHQDIPDFGLTVTSTEDDSFSSGDFVDDYKEELGSEEIVPDEATESFFSSYHQEQRNNHVDLFFTSLALSSPIDPVPETMVDDDAEVDTVDSTSKNQPQSQADEAKSTNLESEVVVVDDQTDSFFSSYHDETPTEKSPAASLFFSSLASSSPMDPVPEPIVAKPVVAKPVAAKPVVDKVDNIDTLKPHQIPTEAPEKKAAVQPKTTHKVKLSQSKARTGKAKATAKAKPTTLHEIDVYPPLKSTKKTGNGMSEITAKYQALKLEIMAQEEAKREAKKSPVPPRKTIKQTGSGRFLMKGKSKRKVKEEEREKHVEMVASTKIRTVQQCVQVREGVFRLVVKRIDDISIQDLEEEHTA
eukprot:scaffold379751_cov59-Attheya_sp.AAC.2